MKILLLAPESCRLLPFMKATTYYKEDEEGMSDPYEHPQNTENDEIIRTMDPIDKSYILGEAIDFVVSYGYHHIIKKDVLETLPDKVINLHISYLPWNRGADPNFWSWADNTPKGVTIHYVDEGIDTGDIIVQRVVDIGRHETLRSSYKILCNDIEALFMGYWGSIRTGVCARVEQIEDDATYNKKGKIDKYWQFLDDGWDTEVYKVNGELLSAALGTQEVLGIL